MTGRYPMRLRLADARDLPEPHLRPADRRAHAAAGAQGGRAIETAMVGKWHLGHADQKYWPQNRGLRPLLRQPRRRGGLLHQGPRRRHRLAAQRQVPQGGRLLHRPDRRRGGQADREPRRTKPLVSLLRLAGAARALSGAAEIRSIAIKDPSRTSSAGPMRP